MKVSLPAKLLAVHDALLAVGVPHAFGSAIALAYCTGDPRGTNDLNINAIDPDRIASTVADLVGPDPIVERLRRVVDRYVPRAVTLPLSQPPARDLPDQSFDDG